MGVLIAIVAVFLAIVGLVTVFLRADPAKLAGGLTLTAPLLLAFIGLAALIAGREAIGGLMLMGAFAWYGSMRKKPAPRLTAARHATVRTAALEMELDHGTGALEGLVLAGRHEGRMLGSMGLAELRELYRDLYTDPESRQLLETYLDGRFPVWRKHAQPDGGERLGVPPGSGPMTKEEAYKVLGLEAGAAPTDVRKAHRRLMQRLRPDIGGTSFLAARINEAKDVLLSNHH
ncbi:MAG TPA: molecular chaperone DnaJ [Mesorhizobium sp.]